MNKVGFLDGNSCHQLIQLLSIIKKLRIFFKGIKYIKKAILGAKML